MRTAVGRLSGARVANLAALMPVLSPSSARGVGHDPDAIPLVRSADGGSENKMPLRIIPDRRKAPEDATQSATAKGWDVFDDDPARRDFLNDAEVFEPEAGSIAAEAGATSGDADILAGEAAADEVGNNSVCCQSGCGEGANVMVAGHSRPMLRQHAAAKRFDFAERNGLHAGALEAEAESANTGEQV